jgi:hypothetical protein
MITFTVNFITEVCPETTNGCTEGLISSAPNARYGHMGRQFIKAWVTLRPNDV